MKHNSCDGCAYDLQGGRDNCTDNVAYECRDGGGFEHWTPRKWKHENNRPHSYLYTCPNCDRDVWFLPGNHGCGYHFCPWCGLQVKGTEEYDVD